MELIINKLSSSGKYYNWFFFFQLKSLFLFHGLTKCLDLATLETESTKQENAAGLIAPSVDRQFMTPITKEDNAFNMITVLKVILELKGIARDDYKKNKFAKIRRLRVYAKFHFKNERPFRSISGYRGQYV